MLLDAKALYNSRHATITSVTHEPFASGGRSIAATRVRLRYPSATPSQLRHVDI